MTENQASRIAKGLGFNYWQGATTWTRLRWLSKLKTHKDVYAFHSYPDYFLHPTIGVISMRGKTTPIVLTPASIRLHSHCYEEVKLYEINQIVTTISVSFLKWAHPLLKLFDNRRTECDLVRIESEVSASITAAVLPVRLMLIRLTYNKPEASDWIHYGDKIISVQKDKIRLLELLREKLNQTEGTQMSYIVVSRDRNHKTGYSMASNPAVHLSESLAKREATRLALEVDRSREYVVLKIVGAVKATAAEWSDN